MHFLGNPSGFGQSNLDMKNGFHEKRACMLAFAALCSSGSFFISFFLSYFLPCSDVHPHHYLCMLTHRNNSNLVLNGGVSDLKSRQQQPEQEDDFEDAPFVETMSRRRPYKPNDLSDVGSDRDDFGDGNKDRFIELAQAALEEATLEDERKGVIQEVVEALIAKTGAPLVAEVISEQLRSQEVIERIAESCEEEEERRRRRSREHVFAPSMLKEPPDAVFDGSSTVSNRRWLISEYIWKLFRILLLASLVGLVYHFMCAFHHDLF